MAPIFGTVSNGRRFVYFNGTSHSAPMVAGAVALMHAKWPRTKREKTADDILLATAHRSFAGYNSENHGMGILNVRTAFQPYGQLRFHLPGGVRVPAAGWDAFRMFVRVLYYHGRSWMPLPDWGNPLLRSYPAFDQFNRDFRVDLILHIVSNGWWYRDAPINPLPTYPNSVPDVVQLTASGGKIAYWGGALGTSDSQLFSQRNLSQSNYGGHRRTAAYMFIDKKGFVASGGYGHSVNYPWMAALTGNLRLASISGIDPLHSYENIRKGGQGLMRFADGGTTMAAGVPLGGGFRLGFATGRSTALYDTDKALSNGDMLRQRDKSSAHAVNLGVSKAFGKTVTLGLYGQYLKENNAFHGHSYAEDSLGYLGQSNKSYGIGLSLGYSPDRNTDILFEANVSKSVVDETGGLIAGLKDIKSNALSIAAERRNLFGEGDSLQIVVRQPMARFSSRTGLYNTLVDEHGYPYWEEIWGDSGVPFSTRQLDGKVSYSTRLGRSLRLDVSGQYVRNYDNMPGIDGFGFGINLKSKF